MIEDLKRRDLEDIDSHSIVQVKQWKQTIYPSAPTTLVGTYQYYLSDQTRKCVGWDIQDYHRRRREGELLPHTPWSKLIIENSYDGSYDFTISSPNMPPYTSIKRYYMDGPWTTTVGHYLTEEFMLAQTPSTYNQYVSEAAARIYSNGYDALTSLAELTQLRRLFVSTAKSIAKIQLPKNINLRTLRRLSCEWLAARYGWRTLIYDIMSLNDAISNFDESRSRYSERCGNKWSTTDINAVTASMAPYFTYDQVESTKVTTSIRGSVTADIVVPRFKFNPLQTAWELIPFSFVIDWFVNVGRSLAAISFLSLQTDYSASCGFKIEVEKTYSASNFRDASSTNNCVANNLWRYFTSKGTYEIRTPCQVPILPSFVLKLNALKIADLLALIVQRFH